MGCCGEQQLKNFFVKVRQGNLKEFKYTAPKGNGCVFEVDFSPQDKVLKKEILNSFLPLNKDLNESCRVIEFETLVAEHPKLYGFPKLTRTIDNDSCNLELALLRPEEKETLKGQIRKAIKRIQDSDPNYRDILETMTRLQEALLRLPAEQRPSPDEEDKKINAMFVAKLGGTEFLLALKKSPNFNALLPYAISILNELFRRAFLYLEKPDSYKLNCPLDGEITLDDFLTFRRWFCGKLEYKEKEITGIFTARENPPKVECEKKEVNDDCKDCDEKIESRDISKLRFFSPLPFILRNPTCFLKFPRIGLRGILTAVELWPMDRSQRSALTLKRLIMYRLSISQLQNCKDYEKFIKAINDAIKRINSSKPKSAALLARLAADLEGKINDYCTTNPNELTSLEDDLFALYSVVALVEGKGDTKNDVEKCCTTEELNNLLAKLKDLEKLPSLVREGIINELARELKNCFSSTSVVFLRNLDGEDGESAGNNLWDKAKLKERNKPEPIQNTSEKAIGLKKIVEEVQEVIDELKASYPETSGVLSEYVKEIKDQLSKILKLLNNSEAEGEPSEISEIENELSRVEDELFALHLIIELIVRVEITNNAVKKCCPNADRLIKKLPKLDKKARKEIEETIKNLLSCIKENKTCISTKLDGESRFPEETARLIKENAEKIFLGLVAYWFYDKLDGDCENATFNFKKGNDALLTLNVERIGRNKYCVTGHYHDGKRDEALFYLTYPKAPWMRRCTQFLGTYLVFTEVRSVTPEIILEKRQIRDWKFGTAKRDCLEKLSISPVCGGIEVNYRGTTIFIGDIGG